MMIIEIFMLILLLGFCIYTSVSDIRFGIISNKSISIFLSCTAVLDIIYYTFFTPVLFSFFLINMSIIIVISAVLYLAHTWAGGDCKLLVAICAMYPAGFYLPFSDNRATLYYCVCFAFMFGLLYLIIDSAMFLVSGKSKINLNTIKASVVVFAKNYSVAIIYTTAIQLIYIGFLVKYLNLSPLILTAVYTYIAFCTIKYELFKSRILLVATLLFDCAMAVIYRVVPIDTNIISYISIFLLIITRAIISSHNYRKIFTTDVQKGMILSTMSTMAFFQSAMKGLPSLSTEDLRSRLTDEEAKNVRKWGISTDNSTVFIVRKIPFAIFISLGICCYFILWRIMR